MLKKWVYIKPQNELEAKQAYDTLRMFVEHCAVSDSESWDAFLPLNGAVQRMSNDTARFDLYRQWLISVLFLNKTVPEYFCAGLGSIAGTYQSAPFHPLGYLAVLDYVRKNHRECWGAGGDAEYAKDSAYDYQHGFDPNHLPSLDSMGLGFLLNESAVTRTGKSSGQYLSTFTGSPNPFKQELTLTFELNRLAYVTVEVFDVLGRKVWGGEHGRSLGAGSHTVRIDGSSLPIGTLYAHISTGFGEVNTLKLVHAQ
jgi:hypothetical protein